MKKFVFNCTFIFVLVQALVLLSQPELLAWQDKSVDRLTQLPASAQAIIFKKVFTYVKSFKNIDNIKVLVVFDENTIKQKDAVIKAFQNEKIQASSCSIENLSFYIKDATVIYLTPGILNSTVKNLSRDKRVLSISGDPTIVMKGYASIGIGNAAEDNISAGSGRKRIIPRIILHLGQLQNESQEISELLSLDSIIKIR